MQGSSADDGPVIRKSSASCVPPRSFSQYRQQRLAYRYTWLDWCTCSDKIKLWFEQLWCDSFQFSVSMYDVHTVTCKDQIWGAMQG